jgi:hypothetical protein
VKRTIRLKSIKDSHTVDFADGGITKDGEPTSQRQALARVMSKRVPVVVDGKETQLPVFLIEHVGEWRFAFGEVAPASDEALAFEADVIQREHPEHLLARWHKARDGFLAKSIEARRQAEAQMEQQMGGEVAKSIQAMVKSVATSTKAVARV